MIRLRIFLRSRGTCCSFALTCATLIVCFAFSFRCYLQIAAAQTSAPTENMNITIERVGACCLEVGNPVYNLAISADGSVLYEGKHFVHAMGFRKSRIPRSAVRELGQKMLDKGYFDLPQSYGSCMDGGMVKTSLEINGRQRMITDGCNAGPDALDQLEDEIDRVTNSKVWVRGRIRLWLHWPWFHSQS